MAFPLAPWHLWGSSKSVQLTIGGLGNIPLNVGQLAKIAYGRPETWRFLFGLTFDGASSPAAAGAVSFVADFSVLAGVGRSALLMPSFVNPSSPGFCRFRVSNTLANLVGRTLWTSAVRAPEVIDTSPDFQPTFETIVAEELQCGCYVGAAAGVTPAAGTKLNVTVHAYFAPNVHIRPEWFTDEHGDATRYLGGEKGGR